MQRFIRYISEEGNLRFLPLRRGYGYAVCREPAPDSRTSFTKANLTGKDGFCVYVKVSSTEEEILATVETRELANAVVSRIVKLIPRRRERIIDVSFIVSRLQPRDEAAKSAPVEVDS